MSRLATGTAVPIGLLLTVQGGGGVLDNLFADSRSWFLINHLDLPPTVRSGAHAVLRAVGPSLVVRRKGWRWLLD